MCVQIFGLFCNQKFSAKICTLHKIIISAHSQHQCCLITEPCMNHKQQSSFHDFRSLFMIFDLIVSLMILHPAKRSEMKKQWKFNSVKWNIVKVVFFVWWTFSLFELKNCNKFHHYKNKGKSCFVYYLPREWKKNNISPASRMGKNTKKKALHKKYQQYIANIITFTVYIYSILKTYLNQNKVAFHWKMKQD